jgi:hypothetical protein
MEYFAYGSNLFTARLTSRVPHASFVAVARLEKHALRFHKRSVDKSAKCNVVASPDEVVLGVIFEVPPDEKPDLDRAEGLGHGYVEREFSVVAGNGLRHTAVAYVADPSYIDDSLLPYTWYKDYVLQGAKEHGFPEAYVQTIARVEARRDPDRERETKERTMLQGPPANSR